MSAIDTVPGHADRFSASRPRAESVRILLRLALLELRRSPMPLMLPLVAVLFWFDAVRTGDGLPVIWTQRASILPNHVLPDFGPVCAGMAAWIAGREQRRGMGDLAESTARPRWLRQLACWGGTLGWTMLAYAAFATIVYALAAHARSWGGPPTWPIVVTGLAIAAFCTAGFVAGAVFPTRFTAPLAALGTLFVSITVFQRAVSAASGWVLISPNNAVPQLDWGVFHPTPPDLSLVQTGFFIGLVIALLGLLGVLSSTRGAQLRRTAFAVTVVGIAACVAGLALANTVTRGKYGFDVPSLHDTASDSLIPYTPDCTQGSAIPVCVHPAFSADLPHAEATFAPVFAEVAGLPGALARATQIDVADLPRPDTTAEGPHFAEFGAWSTLTTSPDGTTVLEFGFADPNAFIEPDDAGYLRSQAAQLVIEHVIAPNGKPDAAQQAVELALLQPLGIPKNLSGPDPTATATATVATAAQHFAALPPSQSHAWLLTHLDALRAGQITPEELP